MHFYNVQEINFTVNFRKLAIKWYRLSAKRGYAEAQFKLGRMYALGYGVPKNYVHAFNWYRIAAENGHIRSQQNLGKMYSKGIGVAKDLVYGFMWYFIANASISLNSEPMSKNQHI